MDDETTDEGMDTETLVDVAGDPTYLLDGSRCKVCKKGTVVTDPVEYNAPVRAKCRTCGALTQGD